MSLALNIYTKFDTTNCYKCGVIMAIPVDLDERFQETGENFYCIHGHRQHYVRGHSEKDKLKKQLSAEKRGRELAQRQAEAERDRTKYAKRQTAYQKGVITKIKKRINHGVCPCCNRTFKQLAAHMKNKHPDYVDNKK